MAMRSGVRSADSQTRSNAVCMALLQLAAAAARRARQASRSGANPSAIHHASTSRSSSPTAGPGAAPSAIASLPPTGKTGRRHAASARAAVAKTASSPPLAQAMASPSANPSSPQR